MNTATAKKAPAKSAPAKAPAKQKKAAANPGGSASVTLPFVKSTHGTHVFGTEDRDGICRQVYLQKSVLGEEPPAEVTMTIVW